MNIIQVSIWYLIGTWRERIAEPVGHVRYPCTKWAPTEQLYVTNVVCIWYIQI